LPNTTALPCRTTALAGEIYTPDRICLNYQPAFFPEKTKMNQIAHFAQTSLLGGQFTRQGSKKGFSEPF